MALQVKQDAERIGDRQWKWSVWLDGPNAELDKIADVEYILHPTFPSPVKHVKSRENKFRLDARGWGEFRIYIKVTDHQGGVEKLDHWLNLFDRDMEKQAFAQGVVPKPVPNKGEQAMFQGKVRPPPLTNVFVSYSVADAPLANALMKELNKLHIQALRLDDIEVGEIVESSLARKMSKVDAGIVIVSDRVSPWMNSEIEALRKYGVRLLIPVFIGEANLANLPKSLQELQGIQIKDISEMEMVAQRVAEAIKEAGET